jgi:hypothetical protein
MKLKAKRGLLVVGTAAVALSAGAQTPPSAPSADALINKLVQKGILTEQEAKDLMNETVQTNMAAPSKWKLSKAIKSIELFGDVRLRYEYRAADNAPGSGSNQDTYYKERFRYAVRVGLRGDLFDDFYYGLRVETSTNPRSTWVTMGDDSNPTPSAKNSDGVNLGQFYIGWRPTDWYDMTVGRMPMPLYTTPIIWDPDINPEGAVERFKFSPGPQIDLFANLGQFLYQDMSPDSAYPSSETFLLAWQIGGTFKPTKDLSLKLAPVIYNYTGVGSSAGLNHAYTGEGAGGLNPNNTPASNQNGINDLLVFEVPGEVNLKVGSYGARLFGDFAYNFYGDDRARAAAHAAPALLPHAFTGENKAYQVGVGFGNLGLVYGQTSKKNTWEVRTYWQHTEQYSVDVNLIDSDFFEGRANLEGVFAAAAYSFSDSIIGTVRYGYASRINNKLGTGGNNPDLPVLNPIKDYNLIQLDLTWRF